MRANFKLQRLFIDQPLELGAKIEASKEQANYLINVLRLSEGQDILIFNGKDGEFLAKLECPSRKKAVLNLAEQTRLQEPQSDFNVLFAPLKTGRMDYVVQKITEMGAGTIQPVFTDHTQLHKLNMKRLEANLIEAAEQCGVLAMPQLVEPVKLQKLLADWDQTRTLIFCDEGHQTNNPVASLEAEKNNKFALLIGPEGGFSERERKQLHDLEYVLPIPLGPRILRADTAIVAAMAIIQSIIGDW